MAERESAVGTNIDTSNQKIAKGGSDYCRGCGSTELFPGMHLGRLPIANELATRIESNTDLFDLTLKVCSKCGLGQVGEEIPPERLFADYRYMSSISSTFVKHANNFVDIISPGFNKDNGDWVLEIASNDGYLLQFLRDKAIPVLGIEPAANIAAIANSKGIPTLNEFFSSTLAQNILDERGFPRFIIANNVLAHVPDINDFVKGISILTGPNTSVSIENPSILNILVEGQFDTIYHEHFSYLSVNSMKTIAHLSGLLLTNVEEIPIHGGSNRYWLNRPGTVAASAKVQYLSDLEVEKGLFSLERWGDAQEKMENTILEFRKLLSATSKAGGVFCGYGAAAKCSTVLNMANVKEGELVSIADESEEKQGRYLPSINIPIESPQNMFERNPTDIVIFPWNIETEIKEKILSSSRNTRPNMWKLVPTLVKIT